MSYKLPYMDAIYVAITFAHQVLLNRFRQGDAAGVAAIYAEDGQITMILQLPTSTSLLFPQWPSNGMLCQD